MQNIILMNKMQPLRNHFHILNFFFIRRVFFNSKQIKQIRFKSLKYNQYSIIIFSLFRYIPVNFRYINMLNVLRFYLCYQILKHIVMNVVDNLNRNIDFLFIIYFQLALIYTILRNMVVNILHDHLNA